MIKLHITSNDKYLIYHIPIFTLFILTITKLIILPYDNITGFILASALIQILLFCCINIDNSYKNVTICCGLFIGFQNATLLFVLTPYVFIKCAYIKSFHENKFYASFLICLIIYIIVVILCINSYYINADSKFGHCICFCNTPSTPKLPEITLPSIHICIKIAPKPGCQICLEDNKIIKLSCNHNLCEICIKKITHCPYCRNPI